MSQQMTSPHDCDIPECDTRGEIITPEGVLCNDHATTLFEEITV